MKICSECNAQNEDNARFCVACGKFIKVQPAPEPPCEAKPEPKPAPAFEAKPEPKAAPAIEAKPEPAPAFEAKPEPAPAFEAKPEPKPAPAFTPPVYTPPTYTPPAFTPPVYTPPVNAPQAPSGRVAEVLRKIGVSPAFIIAIAAFTAYLMASLAAIFSNDTAVRLLNYIRDYWYDISDSFELPYEIIDYLPSVGSNVSVSSFTGLVMPIVIGIGMWCVFASTKKKGTGSFTTGGLTTIKVVEIINLVFVCIGAFVVFVFFVLSSLITRNGFIILMLLLACVVFTLVIVYYARVLSTISAMKYSMTTGIPRTTGVSGYVGVILFIIGTLGAIGAISSLTMGGAFTSLLHSGALPTEAAELISIITNNSARIYSAIASLCMGVSQFTFGIVLFQYKGQMAQLENYR